jgi:hypothetical protein
MRWPWQKTEPQEYKVDVQAVDVCVLTVDDEQYRQTMVGKAEVKARGVMVHPALERLNARLKVWTDMGMVILEYTDPWILIPMARVKMITASADRQHVIVVKRPA